MFKILPDFCEFSLELCHFCNEMHRYVNYTLISTSGTHTGEKMDISPVAGLSWNLHE